MNVKRSSRLNVNSLQTVQLCIQISVCVCDVFSYVFCYKAIACPAVIRFLLFQAFTNISPEMADPLAPSVQKQPVLLSTEIAAAPSCSCLFEGLCLADMKLMAWSLRYLFVWGMREPQT